MRYLRADTSPKARCPGCGEALLVLRWGHEERCARWLGSRRRSVMRIGAALLVLVLAVLVAPVGA